MTATAYNGLREQTDESPFVGAWGDDLRGRRAIAISRDLLEMGLGRGTEIEVEGLPGTYVVLDKMAARWTRRVDIFMDLDRAAARRWGVRPVTIRFRVTDPE